MTSICGDMRRYEPVDTSGRAAVKAPEKKDLGHFVDFFKQSSTFRKVEKYLKFSEKKQLKSGYD